MDTNSTNKLTQQNRSLISALLLLPILLGLGVLAGFVTALQPVLFAASLIALVALLVMVIRPDTATPLVVFLIYSNVVVLGVRFHGVPSLAAILTPALLLLPLFYHIVIRREPIILPRSFPWTILFMIALMISTLMSSNISLAFDELFIYLTEGLMLYILIVNVVRNSQVMRQVIWALLAAGIIMGGVPLYQQLTGTFDNDYGGLAQTSDASFRTGEENLQGEVRQPRLSGAIGEINRFAQVMLMLVPPGIFRFWGERSRLLRLLALAATLLSGAGMVLAFSRGAAVAFALMILLMTFFRVIKPAQLIAFIVVGGILILALPQYSARILSIASITSFFNDEAVTEETSPDGAIRGRATVMLAAARVYADHPIVGIGPGMFRYYSQTYSKELALRNITEDREAHSLFLGLAAETGTVGIFCFVMMLAVTIFDLLKIRKRSRNLRPDLENLATSYILVLMAYLTTGLFLHLSYMRYFWLVFALASAASTIALRELEQTSPEPSSQPVQLGGKLNASL